MSEEIIKILDDLGARFGVAIDWSSENVIPYLKDLMDRYIDYQIYTYVFFIIFLTLFIIGSIISIPKILKYANKKMDECYYSGWGTYSHIIMFILIACSVIAAIVIIYLLMGVIQCITIPEVTIIDYIKSITLK